ncbi:MAG TPA: CrcB family protein [Segeticoccus sp.]|uniref:fluoride efflux transporter FluC n=1 Tax=Segeticoccus sp. TaxID=2706531 RepID=UPI002D7E9BEC|nr:CrcB family protein [Segeticoccus sp.]HET8601116.1 CrcB family protein [Segeticoccus sp.]
MPSHATQRVVTVVALGGALGALARYLIGETWAAPAAGFPTATFAIDVGGSALIGVLMVLVSDVYSPHPLVRPFLGSGFLGGFTTFSTYAVSIRGLLTGGHYLVGLGYLVATPVVALLAVWLTAAATRRLLTRRPR